MLTLVSSATASARSWPGVPTSKNLSTGKARKLLQRASILHGEERVAMEHQALELVLKTKGLDKRQVGNVLLVAPAAEIAERERQEIEANRQIAELAPLRSEFIRIRYASAADIVIAP